MAKFILQLFVLLCAIYMASAAVAYGLPHKDHPGQCWDGEKAYNNGTYYSETCTKLVCFENGDFYIESCGSVSPPEGYENVPDFLKKYPDCCINLVKKEDKENIIE